MERPRKTKIGTEVAHVTRVSDTTFKVKRSRSPGRFTYRGLKDHRQRIPRFVLRRYLDKSIQKKLFCHIQSLQIKTIFQEKKNDYKLNFRKFTVAVYLWLWRHWCQLRWAASAGKPKNEMFLLLQLLLLQPNATQWTITIKYAVYSKL